jgi:hypothetical protein
MFRGHHRAAAVFFMPLKVRFWPKADIEIDAIQLVLMTAFGKSGHSARDLRNRIA